MVAARPSTSSQQLASTFYTLFESLEAEITAIPVVRSEKVPKQRSENTPASVKKLVYGRKTARVGASAKPLDRDNELLYSSEEVIGPKKDRGPS
ncbi:hypothetical protein O181_004390 [Austropuccinia psidii MF-1]|uniref:Uncharacterized protein n=1 Tax=Austropuccinia psidii MF-1 TaxID=1389203 RepID=A0A9Q3BGA3_9BASI|nr:hypothetical protein [Austropuccinia psidii MF-1]